MGCGGGEDGCGKGGRGRGPEGGGCIEGLAQCGGLLREGDAMVGRYRGSLCVEEGRAPGVFAGHLPGAIEIEEQLARGAAEDGAGGGGQGVPHPPVLGWPGRSPGEGLRTPLTGTGGGRPAGGARGARQERGTEGKTGGSGAAGGRTRRAVPGGSRGRLPRHTLGGGAGLRASGGAWSCGSLWARWRRCRWRR